tara:strand:- start:1050 stop:1556 length:507 start_codon:yes stop_codon:yes gene_type:complete
MASTYEPIATVTTSGTTNVITFSSIPNTYTDLRLICNFTSDGTFSHRIQFNSDTASNYANTLMVNNSGAVQINEAVGARWASNSVGVDPTIPSMAIIDIFGYANTSLNKAFLSQGAGSYYTTTGGYAEINVGLWRSTAAINTLKLLWSAGGYNFKAGSIFALYGIKAA